jgi:hypothetical protein
MKSKTGGRGGAREAESGGGAAKERGEKAFEEPHYHYGEVCMHVCVYVHRCVYGQCVYGHKWIIVVCYCKCACL